VTVRLPNGVGIPVRHTRIFHLEDGAWKMVYLHTSIAVPNESIGTGINIMVGSWRLERWGTAPVYLNADLIAY
jgi:hypothetical protein